MADALLGAAGLGDIGTHFPDTDPAYAGVNSMELLGQVVLAVSPNGRSATWTSRWCSRPPSWRPTGRPWSARLAEVVGAPVSVKAKRAETLGALGRREGVACFAVRRFLGPAVSRPRPCSPAPAR